MGLYNTLEELSDKVSKLRNHVATEGKTRKVKVYFPLEDYETNEWVTIYSIEDLVNMQDRLIQSLKNSIIREIPLYSG